MVGIIRVGTVFVLNKLPRGRVRVECDRGHRSILPVSDLRPGKRTKVCPKCIYAEDLFVKRQRAARKRWLLHRAKKEN